MEWYLFDHFSFQLSWFIKSNSYQAFSCIKNQIWHIFGNLIMVIKSYLHSSMLMDYGLSFDLNSFPYVHTRHTDQEQAESIAETAIQSLEKVWKSVRSKSTLEHDSVQKLDITLFPDIHWSQRDQNPALKQPQTHFKYPWTKLWTQNWNHSSLHLFNKS